MDVSIPGNEVAETGEQVITFGNVDPNLGWVTGQEGYSFSSDLSTLFTFTVDTYSPITNALQVTIADGSVLRRQAAPTGVPAMGIPDPDVQFAIFAGAPGGTVDAPIVDIPELSTRVREGHSLIGAEFLTTYQVNIIQTLSGGSIPVSDPFQARLPRSSHVVDGSFSIVKNETGMVLTVDTFTVSGAVDNIRTRAGLPVLSYQLAAGDSAMFVYSTITSAWEVVWHNEDQVDISPLPRIYHHEEIPEANTWTIAHGLNSLRPTITVYDNNNEVIIPDTIVASVESNVNTITITFPGTMAVAGYATLVG